MLQQAPAKYHARLIPNYALGCKRILFDTDYLRALHQDNIEVNWDGIDSIVKNGIVTKKGDLLDFDVIIFATGYATDRYPLVVQGTKGQTVQDYHGTQGGPVAYLGTCLPGFPNFCMLSGPNTATGHTSVIFTEEVQVDYIIKLVKPVIERQIASHPLRSLKAQQTTIIQKSKQDCRTLFGCTATPGIELVGPAR